MAVTAIAVSEDIQDKLDDEGLSDLKACLWAADCQTCGRLLGDDPLALCVDDLTVFAVATLHHQRCRMSAWNDSMMITGTSDDYVSFITRMLLLPVAGRRGGEELWPMMVVNPGLECVQLGRREDGTWRVRPDLAFASAGLVQPGRALRFGVPVEGAVARITDSSIVVTLQVPPFSVYEAPAEEQIVDCARARGGVLMAVTHTLHPGVFGMEDLHNALADPRMLAGWVGLHGSSGRRRRAAPARGTKHPAPRRGDVCVLHWNSRHLSVGKLVGWAPGKLDPVKARARAERMIGREKSIPLHWDLVQQDCPDEGWHTMQALSANRYFLRLYPDGWKLVQTYSWGSGTTAETDNEAKAWAGDVLRFQTGITGLTWEPGPSTPGSVTLYARVR